MRTDIHPKAGPTLINQGLAYVYDQILRWPQKGHLLAKRPQPRNAWGERRYQRQPLRVARLRLRHGNTVCIEWRIHISEMDRLRSILAPESSDDPALEYAYYGLSEDEMRQIGQLCLPPIVPHAIFTGISRPNLGFDAIPYLIHSNFELPLMLEGRKPLAVFGDGYPSDWFDEYLAPFEPFVASGRLVRRIIDTLCLTSDNIARISKE